ncbi:polyamine aminopropyltransferase [Paenalcaligenes niemegkensis]|uniref:polyamine aminopropyltransferase n=1 Tax=Paenalcaligenes niemegkensis TaxID=2895469 RepID=UPI001EE96669|nr:polyamine aminopropyltransferase [Paenalcaligenes niemegkensis]MCQ9616807.1 polyamine aminopropyltransferase [Paenalcaligenes niemegkensis]
MQGLHLTADLYQCSGDLSIFVNESALAALCRKQTELSGLTIVGEKWVTFPEYQGEPGGVTGTLLLAESHLAIHTWPETGGVTLDVYVCNFSGNNSSKAQQLIDGLVDAFQPAHVQRNNLLRGDKEGPVGSGELLLESLNDHAVYGFRFNRRILSRQTKYQHLELLESPDLGLTMRLDGCLMTAEKEEFFYHEAIVHPAAISHPNPRNALIIGGGDGGALEELLKHNTIDRVTLVDLDADVIDVSREYLQAINHGSLDNPRVSVLVGDGAEFVRTIEEKFDLVILDLTDPETPAGPLYTTQFFHECKSVLAPGGAMVLHLGAPFHEPEQVRSMTAALTGVFEHVSAYGLHIPLYGSYWALAVVSDVIQPSALATEDVQQRLADRHIDNLQYYNDEVHGALFALPNYYRKLLPEVTESSRVAELA